MKRKLLNCITISSILLLFTGTAHAQWCVPTTIIPYLSSMPGITHVVIGTIDRTSAADEHYPNNNYTNTGMTTALIMGNTYTISITHTIDASICPDMNLRVWIDYNYDYGLDDVGETVISVDHHLPGTYTGTFTVPLTATPGVTRMRVTAKMSDLGGHTLPTPCDNPADPFGYHGEMEDYNVNITSTTGIYSLPEALDALNLYPSLVENNLSLSFSLKNNSEINMELFDITGKQIWERNPEMMNGGMHEIGLGSEIFEKINSGIYLFRMTIDHQFVTRRIEKL